MTAEEFIEENTFTVESQEGDKLLVLEAENVKEALEMKERESIDKLREIREKVWNMRHEPSSFIIHETIEFLNKYLDGRSNSKLDLAELGKRFDECMAKETKWSLTFWIWKDRVKQFLRLIIKKNG